MRILSIFGTRPSAIKMAPIINELSLIPNCQSYVCLSAQHRQMLDQVTKLFGIKADFDLNIMKHGQTLTDITTEVLTNVMPVIEEVNPDIVLVQGDTTTCFASALAAFYKKIPVGHVEAGLRTHKPYAPFPEELNRQLTGRLATLHFAPTQLCRENLIRENISPENIFVTGNTVIDALLQMKSKTEDENYSFAWKHDIDSWKQSSDKLILVTGHRRENFGEKFNNILDALKIIATQHPNWKIVYPVHLNPNIKDNVDKVLKCFDNVLLTEPLEYIPFIYLMNASDLILTDSGGIQEEAPSLGKPVLVMRDVTERVEAVLAGTVILVGTDKNKIIMEVESLLTDNARYSEMAKRQNPYGDGSSAKKIVAEITKYLETAS